MFMVNWIIYFRIIPPVKNTISPLGSIKQSFLILSVFRSFCLSVHTVSYRRAIEIELDMVWMIRIGRGDRAWGTSWGYCVTPENLLLLLLLGLVYTESQRNPKTENWDSMKSGWKRKCWRCVLLHRWAKRWFLRERRWRYHGDCDPEIGVRWKRSEGACPTREDTNGRKTLF